MNIRRHGLSLFGRVLSHQPGRPWLVTLHGFMQSGEQLEPAMRWIAAAMNILALDLAGHGRTDSCENPARFDAGEMVADVHAWIDRLQLAPCFLHGYSMGGRLAWQLLEAEGRGLPQRRFSGIVIESGHPGYGLAANRAERRSRDEALARTMEADWNGFLQMWSANPVLGPTKADPERARSYAACLRGFGTGAMPAVGIPGGLADHDAWGDAAGGALTDAAPGTTPGATPTPLLLMAGEQDPDYVHLLRTASVGRPNTRFEVISGSRHRIWEEKPDAWARLLTEFVQTNHPCPPNA